MALFVIRKLTRYSVFYMLSLSLSSTSHGSNISSLNLFIYSKRSHLHFLSQRAMLSPSLEVIIIVFLRLLFYICRVVYGLYTNICTFQTKSILILLFFSAMTPSSLTCFLSSQFAKIPWTCSKPKAQLILSTKGESSAKLKKNGI